MSTCFCCSLIHPSSPAYEPYLSWPLTSPNFTAFNVVLRKIPKISPRIFAKALEQGLGIASPDDVSFRDPSIEFDSKDEENEEVLRVFDEVEETKAEDAFPSSSNRIKKKREDKDGDKSDDRFKLRNGREVRLTFASFKFFSDHIGYREILRQKNNINI